MDRWLELAGWREQVARLEPLEQGDDLLAPFENRLDAPVTAGELAYPHPV
jgi:hypothetical protein